MVRTHRMLPASALNRFAFVALIPLALAACGRSVPAPVYYGDSAPAAKTAKPLAVARAEPENIAPDIPKPGRKVSVRRAAPAVSRAEPSGAVRVRPGDTIYGISRRRNVPVRALIDKNSLSPPYTLVIGQLLVLPERRFHTVEQGETIYGLSRRYGVQVTELVAANNIGAPYSISVGQKLLLPGSIKAAASFAPTVVRTPEPTSTPASTSMAKTAPAIDAPQAKPGDIIIPPPSKPLAAATAARKTAPPKAPEPVVRKVVSTSARRSGRFDWPLRGSIISHFGPKAGGLHNDGINIAATSGTPVRAAEEGTVAYAGNELRGFGNLVLIRHKGGWTTAYAHASRLLVKRGDRVKRGQVLAHVGRSGGVDRDQLHFEVRRGTSAVDPLAVLEAASRSG
jgi:murein DD-endopeptidase MepM/ murein hydrolase activator NlpD